MKIYLDSNYMCHVQNDDTRREFNIDFFNGKCQEYIEGYRYIPPGESWLRDDGIRFYGEMITPVINYWDLETAQHIYELSDMKSALEILGVIE